MKAKELRERFAAETTGEQPYLTNYAKWLEKKYTAKKPHQNKCYSCGKSMSDHCPRCEMFQKI